ncbi:MAG: acetyl-CoA carboxylase biotin carboxylase subunit [Anaerolineales bacterium]|nr:acetyl-CoA carboxylase biotin carboxylase subunit [Anaerolineales bacterium]
MPIINIKKVLVANRGEIAVRIIRACRELGIRTVSVYSDADRESLHVRQADEAYHIGPPAPRESYLSVEKLLDVAKRAKVDAIHPGYGFLSERTHFAEAVINAGLVWIGPPPEAIRIMGDKEAARETMKKAGVRVVPGTDPGLSKEEMLAIAPTIGFPLMVKAIAGGGGKGMRIVRTMEELPASVETAMREAESAFGDGRVYLEKLIEGARHIEFQILADHEGNTVHLFERECSIQRRHQKLVEEAPSPIMNDELRAKMGAMAVAAAKAVHYVGAGTIECLVGKDRDYYFLEMNTRIQVEHPITELITGVDLVREQIRVARGRRLSFKQEDLQIKGHALECRINAEDPYYNFMPSVGRISTYLAPSGPGVRLDSGIYEGYEITPYYDPMLAKLVCWGDTRAEAIIRMRRALDEYKVMGIKTNIPFHQHLLNNQRFLAGNYDTEFVEHHFEFAPEYSEDMEQVAAIAAALVEHVNRQQASQIVRRNERDTSNWKWLSRWERMHR